METQLIVKITVQRKQKTTSLTSSVNHPLASKNRPPQLQNPVLLAFLARPPISFSKLRQSLRKPNR